MGIKKIGLGAAVLTSAATLAFAGVASATAAVNSVPTVDYQLCGNVYSGASLAYNAAPPSGAQGVAGVVVKGVISTASGTTYSSLPTDAEGRYCITAPSTMVSDVLGGATVTLTADPATLPSPFTTITNNPWKSASGIFGTSNIGTGIFLLHKVSGFDSANNFHFLVS